MKVKMIPLDQKLVDELKSRYGNHSEVARQLGIGSRNYRQIRNRMITTERTVMQMRFLLKSTKPGQIKMGRPYRSRKDARSQAVNG